MAFCLVASSLAEDVTVTTEKGSVKGVREDHDQGQYYYAFKGIRYAQPPTGKLRFKVMNKLIILGTYFKCLTLAETDNLQVLT